MNLSKYEELYQIAEDALKATSQVDRVAKVIRETDHPVTCKELGELVYGNLYKRLPSTTQDGKLDWDSEKVNEYARHLTARLTQALRHLVKGGFVRTGTTLSEPYTYEDEEMVMVDDNDEPAMIDVWDAKGNKYTIKNPNHNSYYCHREWRKVMKTKQRKITTYQWVGA